MRAHLHRGLGSDRGFTLVEILVAMTMGLIVLAATFSILDLFNQHYTQSNQKTSAQDSARLSLDRIAWELRNTATEPTATGNGSSTTYSPMLIERATAYDIVFDTVLPYSSLSGSPSYGSNVNQVVRVRYCVPSDTTAGSSSNEVLYQEVEYWSTSTPPTSPWSTGSGTTVACPDSPLPSNTISTVLATGVTNRYQQRTDRPLFFFNGSPTTTSVDTLQLPSITSVGMNLFVNPTPTNSGTESELQSGADLRATANFPSAAFTTTSEGTGKVLLNSEAYSPDNNQLTYAWSCSGISCPSSSSSNYLNATSAQYEWSPGSGTYTVTLTATDSSGLSYASTQTVTVS